MHTMEATSLSSRRGRPRQVRIELDLGTPETRAKLQVDTIAALGEDWHAVATRIQYAYALLTADVTLKLSSAERVSRGKREMTDWQARLVALYCDWVDELARRRMPYLTLMAMILDNRTGPIGTLRDALEMFDKLDNGRRVR